MQSLLIYSAVRQTLSSEQGALFSAAGGPGGDAACRGGWECPSKCSSRLVHNSRLTDAASGWSPTGYYTYTK